MSAFISYSSLDKEFVDKLSIELVKNRIPIWRDKWEMKPGDSLIDKIQDGIENSSYLIIVLSNHSVESEWCKKELNAGLIQELEEREVRVIPVLMEKCKIPLFLRDKVYVDFRSDFEEGFNELLRTLASLKKDNMGRITKDKKIFDYAVNWGLAEDRFYVELDFIVTTIEQGHSILAQLSIKGSESATERYQNQYDTGLYFLMKDSIIRVLYFNKDFSTMPVLVGNGHVFRHHFGINDEKLKISFEIATRCVLLGEDNGNDVVIHLEEFLDVLIPDHLK